MAVSEVVRTYYQMLARQCGCWSAAHCMRKRGYALEQCREALHEVRHCTRVWTSHCTENTGRVAIASTHSWGAWMAFRGQAAPGRRTARR